MTPADTATSASCACGTARSVSRSLGRVGVPEAVTPSMAGSCPAATWMPTPARNPTRTVRERKLARKLSRATRAASSIPPVIRAASPASLTYRSDSAAARPVSAAARMAAVAESAATTRWRDEPRTANAAIGRSIVYKPVTSGIPAILAYPRTSGAPSAASVIPASRSTGSWERPTGSTPRRTGTARSQPGQRRPGESGINHLPSLIPQQHAPGLVAAQPGPTPAPSRREPAVSGYSSRAAACGGEAARQAVRRPGGDLLQRDVCRQLPKVSVRAQSATLSKSLSGAATGARCQSGSATGSS